MFEDDTTARRSLVALTSPQHAQTAALVVIAGPDLGRVHALESACVIGRGDDVDVAILDPKISRRHALVRIRQRVAWLEDLGSKNGTFVNGAPVEKRILEPGDRIELGPRVVLEYALLDPEELALRLRLYESSAIDELTGGYNRRYFDHRLHGEAAYAARHNSPLAIVLLDVEEFESLIDRHGSDLADRALVHVAQQVRRRLPPDFVLARYAPARFAVICPGLGARETDALAAELESAVESQALDLPLGAEHLMLHVGSAHAIGGAMELADVLVARAHRALGRSSLEQA